MTRHTRTTAMTLVALSLAGLFAVPASAEGVTVHAGAPGTAFSLAPIIPGAYSDAGPSTYASVSATGTVGSAGCRISVTAQAAWHAPGFTYDYRLGSIAPSSAGELGYGVTGPGQEEWSKTFTVPYGTRIHVFAEVQNTVFTPDRARADLDIECERFEVRVSWA